MSSRVGYFCGLVASLLLAGTARISAQQVTISVPHETVGAGYYEFIGGQWRYFGPGFDLRFGGPFPPTFGGFDPNAGAFGGFAIGGGGTGGMFNFSGDSGGSTSFSSTTPMLTVTNGIPGSLTFGEFRPFVVGLMPAPNSPLIGNPVFSNLGAANTLGGRFARGEFHIRDGRVFPGPDPLLVLPEELAAPPHLFAPPVVQGALAADHRPDEPFVAERAAVETHSALVAGPDSAQAKAVDLWEKGQRLEAEGKVGAARLLYQTAVRQAQGQLRDEILSRLNALE